MRPAAWHLLAMLSLPPAALGAQQPAGTTAFAGTVWGDAPLTVSGKLEAAGFKSVSSSGEDAAVFRGTLVGISALVLPSFGASGRLNVVTVLVKAGPDSSVDVYQQVVQLLSGKYGSPSSVVREYGVPYAAGDGRSAAGISEGKIRLSTSWSLRGELIVVSVGRAHDVVVSYQPVGPQAASEDPL